MIGNNFETVRDAILNKKHVVATYDGFRREMRPHAVGFKNGREQALFYQFGGDSKSGLQPSGSPSNWRCIPLEGLVIDEVRDGEWHTGPNHGRPQTCVDEIIGEVDYSDSQAAGA
jgi:hypothetical protein